jgi:hypothetical protein
MTQGQEEPAGGGASPFTTEMLDALVSGLGSARAMTVSTGWVGHHPAVLRDEASALTLVADKPVDVRALIWQSCGFQPILPGQLPPKLRDSWVVKVRHARVVAVDTQFGAQAAVLGCDWITESPAADEVVGDGRVTDEWLDAARRLDAVVLVSADLGLGPNADDIEVLKAVAAAANSGRLLAGLARLDYQP